MAAAPVASPSKSKPRVAGPRKSRSCSRDSRLIPATQLARNRSTRALWDTNYVDASWINSIVKLIPPILMLGNWCFPGFWMLILGI
jgi:hypothetical protein